MKTILAVGIDVHCWFDALTNVRGNIPLFKLIIKQISSERDTDNDYRYLVSLTYNAEAGRLVFERLKKGSTVFNDTLAETFVYVKDPDHFEVCLAWKNKKIDSLWNFTPAVD